MRPSFIKIPTDTPLQPLHPGLNSPHGYAPIAQSPSSSVFTLGPPSSPLPGRQSFSSELSTDLSWYLDSEQNRPEPDDVLHSPHKSDLRRDHNLFTLRGLANIGCLFILALGFVMLFAGYPMLDYFTRTQQSLKGGFNYGGMNSSGQVPEMPGDRGLIDKDTPASEYTRQPFSSSGKAWELVFSDEFNQDGRSFYPGDDPYWEAVDLHYWQTNNMERYSPEAITTRDGSLEITLSAKAQAGRNYTGGMMSTWNKFCFTGGMILTSVSLPGANNVQGLWPAIWAMGNLGRAGYGASLEGMWPYSYDECDIGTVPNQTVNGLPLAATENGDAQQDGILSFLPGQRLSRCTCEGESHPGPLHRDGTFVGRAAPEIDIFEAQIVVNDEESFGEVSQSCQWAPFNARYEWFNNSETLTIGDPDISQLNSYKGGAFQQATSVVSRTNHAAYEFESTAYATYGFEYKPGFDDAYITWINDDKAAWTLLAGGMAADPRVEIGPRPIPQEPMYIIANLGMSPSFGGVDLENLMFPTRMRVDWIRVYQPVNAIHIGCDPKGFPTQAYITQYLEAYTNANLTTWTDDYKQPRPKNRFLGEC